MLIVQMDWFALNLAIPSIARQFDMASTDLQWVVSGYMISIGALMVTGGRLSDIFGRRKIIVWGLVIFGVMSAICGASPNETWLIAARVVHGVGAALIFPVAIAVVSGTFTGPRQSRAIGVVLGFAAIGTALGPFVGGAFSEYWSWRGVFFINIPFCLAAIFLMLRFVEESRDEAADRHIDALGILTVTGGLVCISLAFDRGEDWGWLSAKTIGTLVGGIVLLGMFVAIERRVHSPLVDLALFRNRVFDAVVIAGSLSNVVFCLVAVFSALYLQQARGYSPFQSGLVFLALSAGAGSASYFSGELAEKYPAARLMAIGMLISTVGILGLTSFTSLWFYAPLFFVTGVGLGLGWALANVATQAVVQPSEIGAARESPDLPRDAGRSQRGDRRRDARTAERFCGRGCIRRGRAPHGLEGRCGTRVHRRARPAPVRSARQTARGNRSCERNDAGSARYLTRAFPGRLAREGVISRPGARP
jgi:MFS family permease